MRDWINMLGKNDIKNLEQIEFDSATPSWEQLKVTENITPIHKKPKKLTTQPSKIAAPKKYEFLRITKKEINHLAKQIKEIQITAEVAPELQNLNEKILINFQNELEKIKEKVSIDLSQKIDSMAQNKSQEKKYIEKCNKLLEKLDSLSIDIQSKIIHKNNSNNENYESFDKIEEDIRILKNEIQSKTQKSVIIPELKKIKERIEQKMASEIIEVTGKHRDYQGSLNRCNLLLTELEMLSKNLENETKAVDEVGVEIFNSTEYLDEEEESQNKKTDAIDDQVASVPSWQTHLIEQLEFLKNLIFDNIEPNSSATTENFKKEKLQRDYDSRNEKEKMQHGIKNLERMENYNDKKNEKIYSYFTNSNKIKKIEEDISNIQKKNIGNTSHRETVAKLCDEALAELKKLKTPKESKTEINQVETHETLEKIENEIFNIKLLQIKDDVSNIVSSGTGPGHKISTLGKIKEELIDLNKKPGFEIKISEEIERIENITLDIKLSKIEEILSNIENSEIEPKKKIENLAKIMRILSDTKEFKKTKSSEVKIYKELEKIENMILDQKLCIIEKNISNILKKTADPKTIIELLTIEINEAGKLKGFGKSLSSEIKIYKKLKEIQNIILQIKLDTIEKSISNILESQADPEIIIMSLTKAKENVTRLKKSLPPSMKIPKKLKEIENKISDNIKLNEIERDNLTIKSSISKIEELEKFEATEQSQSELNKKLEISTNETSEIKEKIIEKSLEHNDNLSATENKQEQEESNKDTSVENLFEKNEDTMQESSKEKLELVNEREDNEKNQINTTEKDDDLARESKKEKLENKNEELSISDEWTLSIIINERLESIKKEIEANYVLISYPKDMITEQTTLEVKQVEGISLDEKAKIDENLKNRVQIINQYVEQYNKHLAKWIDNPLAFIGSKGKEIPETGNKNVSAMRNQDENNKEKDLSSIEKLSIKIIELIKKLRDALTASETKKASPTISAGGYEGYGFFSHKNQAIADRQKQALNYPRH